MTLTEFDSWVATLLDGGPSIFMDSLAMLQSTYPNGSAGVALVRETDPARIYVWDGSTWKNFGDYQGLEPKHESITTPKLANKSITSTKLLDNFNYGGFVTTGSVNDLLNSSRVYLLNNTIEGIPFPDTFFLEVNIYGTRFTQTMRPLSNQNKVYSRSGQIASSSSIAFTEQTPVLSDNQIENKHLANNSLLNNNIALGTDLNTVLRDGPHTELSNGGYLNVPAGFNLHRVFSLYVVPLIKGTENFAIQFFIDFTDPRNIWSRNVIKSSNIYVEWLAYRPDESKDNSLRGSLASGSDMDSIKSYGKYLGVANSGYMNIPSEVTARSFMLDVCNYGTTSAFRIQRITLTNDPSKVYQRYYQDNSTSDIKTEWKYIGPSSGGTLNGKIIVNFGDSIFGNTQGADNISGIIAKLTGAVVHNVGFGSCQMSEHAMHWDAFSMYRLAEAMASGDWILQDAAIAANLSGMPGYFATHLARLKAIDWSTVNFITIGYGKNDYTAGDLLDNPSDKYDTTTHGGALRYSIDTISNACPHIKILVLTPTYRFWMNEGGTFKEDSDMVTYNANDDTLDKFAENAIKVAKEYKLPSADLYNKLGINRLNRSVYFPANGGTHHNAAGRERIAERIVGGLTIY